MARPRIITKVRTSEEVGAIRVNPVTGLVYFLHHDPDGGAVGVLNPRTNRIIARIDVGRLPSDLKINSRTNRVYIPNFRDASVSVISGRMNRVIQTVSVGPFPDTVGIHTRRNLIYVTSTDGTLSVINGSTNRVQQTIRVGGRPSEIAINEQTNRVYVTNTWNNSVTVINGSTQRIIRNIKVGRNPVIPPALNPVTNRIYVANNLSRFLSVINGRTNRLLRNIQLDRLQSEVTVNPRTNRIYVSSAQVEGPGRLFIIHGSTHRIIRTMNLPTFSNLFINPNTNHLFISDFDKNNITVYHAATLKQVAAFSSAAGNFSIHPATNRIYVSGSRSITVIQDAG